MEVNLIEIKRADKTELVELMIEYFQEIDPSKVHSKAKPKLEYPYLDSYWEDSNREALFIEHQNSVIGFVLINDWIVLKEYSADKSIAEFYIIPGFRRRGLGCKVAHKIFSKFKCLLHSICI